MVSREEQIAKEIKDEFCKRVIPSDLMRYLPCLTTQDIEKVQAEEKYNGSMQAADCLLQRLVRRSDWLHQLKQALLNPDVGLVDFGKRTEQRCQQLTVVVAAPGDCTDGHNSETTTFNHQAACSAVTPAKTDDEISVPDEEKSESAAIMKERIRLNVIGMALTYVTSAKDIPRALALDSQYCVQIDNRCIAITSPQRRHQLKEEPRKQFLELTDSGFGETSRIYDGHFVECIDHNHSRNNLGEKKVPNRYIVDCIIQELLDAKRMKMGKRFVPEQLLTTRDIPEYTVLVSIRNYLIGGPTLSTALSEKFITGAIKRPDSMLCRLILSLHKHLNSLLPVYINALKLAMENSKKDYAKAIACFITRLFVRRHIHSFESIRDIWPAFVCNCKESGDAIFCSKTICIVIESTSKYVDVSLPVMFSSVNIKLLPHKDKDETEAKLINNRIKHIKNIPISKEISVTGETADILFKKHSKLTIITNSLCKSKGYHSKQNHEIVEGPCIQLYCRVKGLIPIGEEHFPHNVCGLQTDIIEGHSSLTCNIRIGDMVGRNGKVGTLGGFVKVRGDLAFLTCCHVIADTESLAPVNISFDDESPVFIECFPWYKMNDGANVRRPERSYVCGRIREAPAFETDNSEKVSLDAVLVTIKKKGITIDKNNLLASADDSQVFSMTALGLKTEYLNENCIDYNQLCYNLRPHVKVVSSGAISGLFFTHPEIAKDVNGTSIDLQSFQDSFVEVTRDGKQHFISWINEILNRTDSEDDMPIDVGKFIENKCGIRMPSETKADITYVIKQVVDQLRADSNLANNIESLLEEEIRKRATKNATIFGGTHIQTHFLAKTAEMRDIRRLSRRMYNQIYITDIPFQSGDSGTCVYVIEPRISGCVGMAIADHPGGGCIATPIMEILKHFKIRIKNQDYST